MPRLASFATLLLATAVACPAQREFFQRTQEPDGSWSAEHGDGDTSADLRVTALVVLALLGDGSTLRAGPSKAEIKGGVRWLRDQVDDQGRMRLRADPDWLQDHAMATFALCEAARLSTYRAILPPVLATATALATQLEATRPRPAVEVQLWAELVAQSLRRIEDPRVAAVAAKLDAALAPLPAGEATSGRGAAAQQLLGDLRRDLRRDRRQPTPDATAPPPAANPPEHWPEDVAADPLHTFYVAATALRRGEATWRTALPRLQILTTTQVDDIVSEAYGSWEPVGAFGAANGRIGTAGITALSVEIYYRYCKLVLFE